MSFQDFMSKVRYWDNITAKWMMRHFYVMFFQIVLILVFLGFFANTLKVIDLSVQIPKDNISERLNFTLTVNSFLIVLLLLLNSFWMLYMFNLILRIQTVLRDINFNLSRQNQNQKFKNIPDKVL